MPLRRLARPALHARRLVLTVLLGACADGSVPDDTTTAPPAPDGAAAAIGDAFVAVDLGGGRSDDARPPTTEDAAPEDRDARPTVDFGSSSPPDVASPPPPPVDDAAVSPADGPAASADGAPAPPRDAAVPAPDGPPPDAVAPSPDVPLPDAAPADPCVADPPDCTDLDGPCVVGACEPGTGACVPRMRPDDTPCDDSEPCTTGDVCEGGACVPGGPTDCSAAGGACRIGACVPGVGCEGQARPDGEPCDDADACTVGELCTAGTCGDGAPLDCRALAGACADAVCDSAAGGCVALPHPDGERCDDGADLCTERLCLAGACAEPRPVDCQAGAAECTVGRCDAFAGCLFDQAPACTPCNGGAGVCDEAGGCRPAPGIADGFDAPALAPAWVSGGDAGWVRVDAGAPDGGVARSARIDHNEVSEVSRVVDLAAPAPLRFRYRITSEANYDFFRFRLDGADVVTASGRRDWTVYEGVVPAGRHTLTFRYDKDVSINFDTDRVDVDDVVLTVPCP